VMEVICHGLTSWINQRRIAIVNDRNIPSDTEP
jgi:hypothetical protein